MGKLFFALFNFLMISFLQKCSRKNELSHAGSKKCCMVEFFNDIFVLLQETHRNCESANMIRNKNIPKVHPNTQCLAINPALTLDSLCIMLYR